MTVATPSSSKKTANVEPAHLFTTPIDNKPLAAMADPQPEKAPSRSFRSFIWDTDTHLKSREERVLLRKLDWSILTIGCLGFFMKYLDQGNLSNAYVSGMQEDLRMFGNEYTYAQTAYTCAYAVMQVPSTLIVQRVRPSVWLAAMEVAWGVFTFAQAGTHNVSQLYAFRFFVGFFESSFFPVLLYVLGSWYTRTELAKRVAIFHMTAPLGSAFGESISMFSGIDVDVSQVDISKRPYTRASTALMVWPDGDGYTSCAV